MEDTMTERTAPDFLDEQDDVQFSEPIKAKRDCKIKITFAEGVEWTVKNHVVGYEGKNYKALKLTVQITDDDVETEHPDAKAKLTVEDQFNIQRYPYVDKKSGDIKMLGRNKLYQLEEAMGFDPVFVDRGGDQVEPFETRTGRKIAPKGVDGVKRKLNPEFWNTFFDTDGNPKIDNFIGQELLANIGVEKSEQYGDKNIVTAYKRP